MPPFIGTISLIGRPTAYSSSRIILTGSRSTALGRAWTLLGSRKKPEARRMFVHAAESPPSLVRGVSLFLVWRNNISKRQERDLFFKYLNEPIITSKNNTAN